MSKDSKASQESEPQLLSILKAFEPKLEKVPCVLNYTTDTDLHFQVNRGVDLKLYFTFGPDPSPKDAAYACRAAVSILEGYTTRVIERKPSEQDLEPLDCGHAFNRKLRGADGVMARQAYEYPDHVAVNFQSSRLIITHEQADNLRRSLDQTLGLRPRKADK